jgi:hypothetical protein
VSVINAMKRRSKRPLLLSLRLHHNPHPQKPTHFVVITVLPTQYKLAVCA